MNLPYRSAPTCTQKRRQMNFNKANFLEQFKNNLDKKPDETSKAILNGLLNNVSHGIYLLSSVIGENHPLKILALTVRDISQINPLDDYEGVNLIYVNAPDFDREIAEDRLLQIAYQLWSVIHFQPKGILKENLKKLVEPFSASETLVHTT